MSAEPMHGLLDPAAPRSLLQPAAPAARLLSRDDCRALTQKLLGFAKADETRVTIQSAARGNTRFAVNQVSTAGDSYDAVVVVRSVFGRRAANAVTNKLDDASLRAVVERAEALARLAPEDPELVPELGPQEYAQSRAWSDATARVDAAARAAAVRAVTVPAQAAGHVATGYMETQAGATAIANSKGLFAYERQTDASMTTTVRTPDGTGSGWAGAAHNDFTKIDAAALGARAIEKARASMNPVAVEPGRYTVVLEPTAVGNLVRLMAFAMQARAADEGRSFFTKPGGGNKIGMKVVDERVSLTSDPLDPDAPAGAFVGDGLPTRRVSWIDKGVVQNLAYDRYWAQKQNKAPVPLVGSLRMSGGTTSVEQMIASTERGLLVTRLWYIRPVDPRTILYTGLTRDGTFLIERGKITRAVKNLRWNESPVFLLNNIEAMGRPVRVSASEDGSPGGAIVVPPVKARDFTFTSLSDAV
jgi:predicted Zn-dependent protease